MRSWCDSGWWYDHRQSFYFRCSSSMCHGLLNAKQGGSFAFCLIPIPEVVVLEASPVFLASAAMNIILGHVMHHNSSSLWGRSSNVCFPGGFSSIGLWLLQWQSYWCLLESTPRGLCWWILWINAREFFSVEAAFIYWVLNIHNCYGSCWSPQRKGYQDPLQNRPVETEMAPLHGWLSQLPLFFTSPCS